MPLADRIAALAAKLKVTAPHFGTTLTMMEAKMGLEIEITISRDLPSQPRARSRCRRPVKKYVYGEAGLP